jgi:hypothetical protein
LYSTTFSDDGQTYLWNNGIDSQPAVIEEEEEPFELQKQVTAALAAVPNMIAPLIEEIPWLLPRWMETESSKKKARLPGHTLFINDTIFMDEHDKPDDKKV